MRHESRIEPPLLAVRDLHFLFFSFLAHHPLVNRPTMRTCVYELSPSNRTIMPRQHVKKQAPDTGPGVFLHQGRRASRKSNSLLLPSGQQVESQPAMQLSKTRSLQTPSALFPNQQFEVVEGSTRWQGNEIPGS
mmetsp:Transcript_1685/g.2304  ORF Transcript_1685/g.2304 Transcript_1685/m.2304 type:complete len:134 (+) Transcript_1685:400-801(+)